MSKGESGSSQGYTIIEILAGIAVLMVMLAGGRSWSVNYEVRNKLSEALLVTEPVKKDITITCAEGFAEELTNASIGLSQTDSPYIESLTLGGSCGHPIITLQTANTGLIVNPTFVIAGLGTGGNQWTCSSSGLEVHTPAGCLADSVQ